MTFAISLILPPRGGNGSQVKPPVWDHAAEMVDDNPDRPLFLTRAADIFSANGVRLELKGFFKEPLSLPSDVGLVDLLENLPELLRFLLTPTAPPYTLKLWEQGIQTEFAFENARSCGSIEIACSSTGNWELDHNRESVPRCSLVSQVATFVDNYREATMRYVPELLGEVWNQKLFSAVAELARTFPPRGSV